MKKDEGSVCEPYQAIFYFQQMKMIQKEWCTAVFKIVMLVVVFLVSIYLTQQSKSQLIMGICCFCAGMLLNIPVEAARTIWRSSRCIKRIVFDNSGIIINGWGSRRQVFFKSNIAKIEQKGEYLKIGTLDGKKHSYWLGGRYSMPALVNQKLNAAIHCLYI